MEPSVKPIPGRVGNIASFTIPRPKRKARRPAALAESSAATRPRTKPFSSCRPTFPPCRFRIPPTWSRCSGRPSTTSARARLTSAPPTASEISASPCSADKPDQGRQQSLSSASAARPQDQTKDQTEAQQPTRAQQQNGQNKPQPKDQNEPQPNGQHGGSQRYERILHGHSPFPPLIIPNQPEKAPENSSQQNGPSPGPRYIRTLEKKPQRQIHN